MLTKENINHEEHRTDYLQKDLTLTSLEGNINTDLETS